MTNADALSRFARLALDCVSREYPSHVSLLMASDADARPPRELTPAFHGCFDWHSAVHGHWLLTRLLRLHPEAPWAAEARAALHRNLTAHNIARELDFIAPRPGFERPYGLAWLLALHAELDRSEETGVLAADLTPLAQLAAGRFASWLPRLSHPIRSGTHSQTAFALGLVREWARAVHESTIAELVRERALAWHAGDRDLPLHLEPSGEDFLSPSLGVADLLAQLLSPSDFADWLGRALPTLPTDGSADWLEPVTVTDASDGRLAHLDGLNLSRAWMLQGTARALPDGDRRTPALRAAAARHRERGLAAVTGEHYEGGHWLGTFAVYLLTREAEAHV